MRKKLVIVVARKKGGDTELYELYELYELLNPFMRKN